MSLVKVHQSSFHAGEIAPEMLGRTDDTKQTQGLATCENFICTPQGPVENRAGTEFIRAAKYPAKPTRLISFNRGPDESMCLEFGDKYIRFHTQGMTLLKNGSPYEVVTPYAAEDVFDLCYSQSIDVITITHPKYPPYDLKRYAPNDWRMEVVKLNNSFSAPTGVSVSYHCQDEGGTIKNKTAYTLSYVVTACNAYGEQESEASQVATVQGNLYITSAYARVSWTAVPGATVYKVYKSVGGLYGYIGQTRQLYIDDDNISADMSITPKYQDDPFGLTKAITSVQVTNQGSNYRGKRNLIGYAASGKGCRWDEKYGGWFYGGPNDWVDISLPCYCLRNDSVQDVIHNFISAKVVDAGGTGKGATVKLNTVQTNQYLTEILTGFTITNAGSGYTNPKIQVWWYQQYNGAWDEPDENVKVMEFDAYVDEASGVTLTVSDSTGSGAVLKPVLSGGKITSVEVISGGSGYSNPTVTASGYSGSGATFNVTVGGGDSYPVSVARFEQRRIFAGSYQWPQHIWMTRNGTEDDMSYRLPYQDDDRISVDMASSDGGEIRHVVSTTQLMILTDGGEYRVTPINSDAITPTSMNIRPQSFVGSSTVQPLLVNNNVIYVAARGGHVREWGYSYQAGGYVTGDISLRATHLFDYHDITDLAYQKSPYPIVWAVSSSGALLSATYIPEQAVLGWSKQTTYRGTFESVCTVPEGDTDSVYVVVNRIIQGDYHRLIERMKPRNFPTLEDSYLVDSGVTVDTRGSETTFSEVGGLAHLEDCEVAILADGAVYPNQVVQNGKVILKNGDELANVQIAHVGLPISAHLTTLPARIGTSDGTMGRGRQKKVNTVWARVLNSSGVWAGPKGGTLVESKNRTTEPAGSPPSLKNTEIEIRIPPSVNSEGQIDIEQREPLPLTLLALTMELDVSN